jgi:hypothetical protein
VRKAAAPAVPVAGPAGGEEAAKPRRRTRRKAENGGDAEAAE